jgi:hypothetical protein
MTRSSAVNRRKTCKHYSDPSEQIGEDGKHYTGTCISCNEQIVGCLLCEYSFAESTRRRYSRDAYFNLHMGKNHKEMLHRSKIQKTSNVSLPDHEDETRIMTQLNALMTELALLLIAYQKK